MLKALLYAITHVQRLPSEMQESSDMFHMCDVVRRGHDLPTIAIVADMVRLHTAIKADIWPEGSVAPEDRSKREAYVAEYENRMASLLASREAAMSRYARRTGSMNG